MDNGLIKEQIEFNEMLSKIPIASVKYTVLNGLISFVKEIKENYGKSIIYHKKFNLDKVYGEMVKNGYFVLSKDNYLKEYSINELVKVLTDNKLFPDATEITNYVLGFQKFFDNVFLNHQDFTAMVESGIIKDFVIYDNNMEILTMITCDNFEQLQTVIFEL